MGVGKKLKTAFSVFKKEGVHGIASILGQKSTLFLRRLRHRLRGLLYRAGLLRRKESGKLRILYITTNFESTQGQTVRYRIHNLRQAIEEQAETNFEILENGIYADDALVGCADIIILMRVFRSQPAERLIRLAHRYKKPLVYDIDDLIFLPEYARDFCSSLDDTREQTVQMYTRMFRDFGFVFDSCCCATASTGFIARKMREKGKKAYIVHNGLNQRQIEIAQGLKKSPRVEKTRYIGYLSGSKTHDVDFKQAAPAVAKILMEYPDVKLRLAGYIQIGKFGHAFSNQIETTGFMHWEKLLQYGSENDINIAPLNIENPFCHAKSELKYFEAAIVGVPTVASPTDTFKSCIRHSENGMLASDTEEWYRSIKALLDDRELYERIQKNAWNHVQSAYTPRAIAKEAMDAYRKVLNDFQAEVG